MGAGLLDWLCAPNVNEVGAGCVGWACCPKPPNGFEGALPVVVLCVCAPNENDGVVCAPPVGPALNPLKGLFVCCPKPLELDCCGWLWPKVNDAAGAGVDDCSILSMPFPSLDCCWPKVKLPEPPKPVLGCCCAGCAPKPKLLGVVVKVLGGVKVVLGPAKGDAERPLPPLLMLAILFELPLVFHLSGSMRRALGVASSGSM